MDLCATVLPNEPSSSHLWTPPTHNHSSKKNERASSRVWKKKKRRERGWEKSTGQWIWMRDPNLDALKLFMLLQRGIKTQKIKFGNKCEKSWKIAILINVKNLVVVAGHENKTKKRKGVHEISKTKTENRENNLTAVSEWKPVYNNFHISRFLYINVFSSSVYPYLKTFTYTYLKQKNWTNHMNQNNLPATSLAASTTSSQIPTSSHMPTSSHFPKLPNFPELTGITPGESVKNRS